VAARTIVAGDKGTGPCCLDNDSDLERWRREYPDHVAARERVLQELKEKLEAP